jgi:hypothetical protein
MTTQVFLGIVIFLIGLYFYSQNGIKEGFNGKEPAVNCPNLLIQKDSKFYLHNTKQVKVPGVNPIEFDNLEDYTEFIDWQRSQNINCPVLYLQNTYDAQGNPVFKIRPSVSDLQGGLNPSNSMPQSIASSNPNYIMESTLGTPSAPAYPNPSLLVDAARNDPPYNKNSYPGFDPSSFYVGSTTPLDGMNHIQENANVSPDAMDSNWGGSAYTQSLVKAGYYKGNDVKLAVG